MSQPVTPPAKANRWLTVLLAAVMIVGAGAVVRLANWIDQSDKRLYATVAMNEPVRLSDTDTHLMVTKVEIGSSYLKREQIIGTTGRFVMVTLSVSAGRDYTTFESYLVSHGKTYQSVEGTVFFPEPGFVSTGVRIFEVPTEATDEFVLEFGELEIVSATQRWVRVKVTMSEQDLVSGAHLTLSEPEREQAVER